MQLPTFASSRHGTTLNIQDSQGLLKLQAVFSVVMQVFLSLDDFDMYAKCGAFIKAQKVLDKLSVLDVLSWNALIARYVQ